MKPSKLILLLLAVLTLYQQHLTVLSQCFDTKYLKTKYTALRRPDYEILDVTREEYCKTHCSGNSSCAAFVYNTENSTCVLSGEPDVILNGYITDVKNVTVKKRFYSELLVQDEDGPCDEGMQFLNAHQYYSARSGGTIIDIGTFWSVTYNKTRGDTGIRIIQHNTARGHFNDPGKCSHWFVQFNGEKCTNPGTIEQLDFSESTGDFHKASDIDGICWDMAAGDVVVETVVGWCDGFPQTDTHTAWNSAITTLIMEVIPYTQVDIDVANNCPMAITFNYHHFSWDEELDVTYDFSSTKMLVKAVIYNKTGSDTSLKIKYSALLSVKMIQQTYKACGRWFIAVNGTECDPVADAVIYGGQSWNYWRHHRRVQTIEGICDNELMPGLYSVEVWVGECYLRQEDNGNPFTQPTNMISGSLDPNFIYKKYGPGMQSVQQWQLYSPWFGVDDGDVFTITYYKEYSDTGVRLTASGNHRMAGKANNDGRCSRWYFKIDGNECQNPGPIEAVSFYSINDVHYYLSMQTRGVCHDITTASHTITYAVGACPGYNLGAAFTGWRSSLHVFVEELRLESVKDCGTVFPVNCDN